MACAYLIHAVFVNHSATLYVYGRNLSVALFHAANFALLIGGAAVLVPSFGIVGYGIAEICAIAAYVILHRQLVRTVFPVSYSDTILWLCGFAPLMFVPLVPDHLVLIAAVPLATVLLLPRSRRQITSNVSLLRRAFS